MDGFSGVFRREIKTSTNRSVAGRLMQAFGKKRLYSFALFSGGSALCPLAGDVPADLAHFTDRQLVSAAALMRRYHDATVELARSFQREAEVVCHNDWGPTNTVFRNEQPWGIIDFDTAAPGGRLWDLGYAAFLWLDLGNRDYSGAGTD